MPSESTAAALEAMVLAISHPGQTPTVTLGTCCSFKSNIPHGSKASTVKPPSPPNIHQMQQDSSDDSKERFDSGEDSGDDFHPPSRKDDILHLRRHISRLKADPTRSNELKEY